MSDDNFTLKAINALSEKNFFVPSYQRGYRWGKQQVTDLLNDIHEATTDYCIQPLVVQSDDSKNYNVIDGQQRLTTIFLILKALGAKTIFTLTFETRRESSDFLNRINETYKDCKELMSPDEYYISTAYECIIDWLNTIKNHEKLEDQILNHTQFIWYETPDNAYDTFCRLNSGKISLSNAELIKALLFKDKVLKESGAPGEWDRIEQKLQENDFWYFICPDPESERFEATHLDLLFEMLLRASMREFHENKEQVFGEFIADLKNIPETLNKNPYFIFSRLLKANTSPQKIWTKILSIFRRMNYWYENRRLYHDIGFLMNLKSKDKEGRFNILVDLLLNSETQTKANFSSFVNENIKNIIFKEDRKLEDLVYNENNSELNDVLLLFNIAIMNCHECEISRYPFAQHKKGAWSLEHIHAKNERAIDKDDILKIAMIVGIKKDDIDVKKENIEQLVSEINKRTNCNRPQWELIKQNQEKQWIIDDANENTNGLSNLALLASAPNAALNNKIYMEKREIISQWERDETTAAGGKYNPAFIPIGTRMVFFKHFSGNDRVPFMWTADDGKRYLEHLVDTLSKYVGIEQKTKEK